MPNESRRIVLRKEDAFQFVLELNLRRRVADAAYLSSNNVPGCGISTESKTMPWIHAKPLTVFRMSISTVSPAAAL